MNHILQRHDTKVQLRSTDPVLALLCEINAMGERLIYADVCDASKLTMCGETAMTAIQSLTGHRRNPLYVDLDRRHPDRHRAAAMKAIDILALHAGGPGSMRSTLEIVQQICAEALADA